MTKYILHGGVDKNLRDKYFELNQDYFREGVRGFQIAKILLVYFARTEEDLTPMFENDKHCFQDHSPQIRMEFQMASKAPDKFREQVKSADIIYVMGGVTSLLIDQIKKTSDFGELLQGKVYMGSSAGMNLIAKYYFSDTKKIVGEGLGTLQIKSIPHWSNDMQQELELLKSTGENLPVVKIKEYEFKVLEV